MLMNTRKRWATKEEARNYVSKCFDENHFGLKYCAACDFLGIDAAKYRENNKSFQLGLWEDYLISMPRYEAEKIIQSIKDEALDDEYANGSKSQNTNHGELTAEEYLKWGKMNEFIDNNN